MQSCLMNRLEEGCSKSIELQSNLQYVNRKCSNTQSLISALELQYANLKKLCQQKQLKYQQLMKRQQRRIEDQSLLENLQMRVKDLQSSVREKESQCSRTKQLLSQLLKKQSERRGQNLVTAKRLKEKQRTLKEKQEQARLFAQIGNYMDHQKNRIQTQRKKQNTLSLKLQELLNKNTQLNNRLQAGQKLRSDVLSILQGIMPQEFKQMRRSVKEGKLVQTGILLQRMQNRINSMKNCIQA